MSLLPPNLHISDDIHCMPFCGYFTIMVTIMCHVTLNKKKKTEKNMMPNSKIQYGNTCWPVAWFVGRITQKLLNNETWVSTQNSTQ